MQKRELRLARALLFATFAMMLAVTGAQAGTINVGYTGSVVYWTAPSTAVYDFTLAGAQGGQGSGTAGGNGAWLNAYVSLTAGTQLGFAVGGMGYSGNFGTVWGGGGGGGTFVFDAGWNPLAIAGGGGGAG